MNNTLIRWFSYSIHKYCMWMCVEFSLSPPIKIALSFISFYEIHWIFYTTRLCNENVIRAYVIMILDGVKHFSNDAIIMISFKYFFRKMIFSIYYSPNLFFNRCTISAFTLLSRKKLSYSIEKISASTLLFFLSEYVSNYRTALWGRGKVTDQPVGIWASFFES